MYVTHKSYILSIQATFSDFFDITAQYCSVEEGSLLMIFIEWNDGYISGPHYRLANQT